MPAITTDITMPRLLKMVKLLMSTLTNAADSRAPPRPAMPADSMKTPSLSRIGFCPRVAEAAGLSFMAMRRWPKPLRRSITMSTPSTAKSTVRNMRNVPGLRASIGPIFGAGTFSDPFVKMVNFCPNQLCWVLSSKSMCETNTPNAMVPSARYSPRNRSAGRATSPPTRAQTRKAATSPQMVI